MPEYLVEFPTEGGGRIVVEMDRNLAGPIPASTPGEIAERVKTTFEEVATGMKPLAQTILNQLTDLGPQALTVEFGVKFSAKAGVVLASAAGEGHCKVTLNWNKGTSS
jgi:hypothetical protein